jgi:hypothetical protein
MMSHGIGALALEECAPCVSTRFDSAVHFSRPSWRYSLPFPPSLFAESHLVNPAALHQELLKASRIRKVNQEAKRDCFLSPVGFGCGPENCP